MTIQPRSIRWYRRDGRRATTKDVARARQNYAEGKRTGRMGDLRCNTNLTVADRVERMTLIEFANWSGQFTYRFERERR